MDTAFCLAALDDALQQGKPAIFNTDRAPGGAFIRSGDNTLFPVERETAQRLTQSPKGQRGQSVTPKKRNMCAIKCMGSSGQARQGESWIA